MAGAIQTVAVIGGGVIGGGWAARCLLRGIDVTVFDPDPAVERKVNAVIDNADHAYEKLNLVQGERGMLSFADSLPDAVRDADFVQENTPENETVKKAVLADIAAATRPDTIIASSTSGLLPSRLQVDCLKPERIVVGHPFNPVYLLPLVEICGGELTSADVIARAESFYRTLGMRPLLVRKEIDGFVADRLMEALWREALHLVNDGVATTSDIDDAIIYGAGMRWAFMGPFLTFWLAGGEGGMRHFMEQFGPALQLPWTKLEAPELTDDLLNRIVEQSDEQTEGQDVRALERQRDECLIALMEGLAPQNIAAGNVLNEQRGR
jgi:carnitine 3-dehydrogenase